VRGVIEEFIPSKFIEPAEKCGCGFKHEYTLKAVLFGELEKCLGKLEEYGIDPPYAVFYDEITYKVAGKRVLELIGGHGLTVESPTYSDARSKLEKARKLKPNTVVAVGGGAVIDVTRYIAYEGGFNFVAIPTAPSNDGIASPRAALYHRSPSGELVYTGTAEAKPPDLVIFDLTILSSAPKKLISSGYGDIISKLVSSKDWQLARDEIGERYCRNSEKLLLMSVSEILKTVDSPPFDSPENVKALCKALILSSTAMGIVGSTRPGGGSEHMVARHLEIYFKRKIPHGIAVAIGTVAMAALHQLKNPNWWKEEEYQVEAIRRYLSSWNIPTKLEELSIPTNVMIEAITESWKTRPERYTILHKVKPDTEMAKRILTHSNLL